MNREEQIETNNNLKLIAKSSLFILLMLVFSKFFAYFYRIIIARHFGPEIYGIFTLASIILGLGLIFSSLGLPEGIMRFIPIYRGKKENNKIQYVFRFAFIILLLSSCIISGLLFFYSKTISIELFHEPQLEIFIRIFSFFLPLWTLGTFFLAFLKAFEKAKIYSFIEFSLQTFIKVAILIILIFIGLGTNSIIFSFGSGILALFLTSWFFSKKYFPFAFKHPDLNKHVKRKIFKKILNYSLPIMFFGIISLILYWIDSFFLGIFKGTTSVGFYNAVVPIALLLEIAPLLFFHLFFPLIMKNYSQNRTEVIRQTAKQVSKWIFMINLPVFILFLLFPRAIINSLFGPEYLVATHSLRILSFGALVASTLSVSRHLLSMVGKSKIIMVNMIFASTLNIVLNIWLIPQSSLFGVDNSLGIYGAALATTISIIFSHILLLIQAAYFTSIIPLKRKMINIFLISIIPATIIFLIRNTVKMSIIWEIFLGAFFFLAYFCLILVFKGFDKNDLEILRSFYKKISKAKTRYCQVNETPYL